MIEAFLFPHGSTGGQNCHGLVHGVKLAKAIAVDARAQLVVVDVFDGLLELMLAVIQNVVKTIITPIRTSQQVENWQRSQLAAILILPGTLFPGRPIVIVVI